MSNRLRTSTLVIQLNVASHQKPLSAINGTCQISTAWQTQAAHLSFRTRRPWQSSSVWGVQTPPIRHCEQCACRKQYVFDAGHCASSSLGPCNPNSNKSFPPLPVQKPTVEQWIPPARLNLIRTRPTRPAATPPTRRRRSGARPIRRLRAPVTAIRSRRASRATCPCRRRTPAAPPPRRSGTGRGTRAGTGPRCAPAFSCPARRETARGDQSTRRSSR